MSPARRIKVLVAEDDEGVRGALGALIEGERAFRLVGTAGDADEAVELARSHTPDVALVDVRMAGGGGLAAVRGIGKHSPGTKVIALSAASDRSTVLEMLQAGVVGYVVKGGSVDEIVESVRRAASGEGTLSVELTTKVIDELVAFLSDRTRDREQYARRVQRMEDVIHSAGFVIVFQPIVSLADGRVVGAEALSRFEGSRPRGGPSVWFAEAEELGLREKLELAAVQSAFCALPELPDDVYLSVNASPETLASGSFRKLVMLIDGSRVVVEITEYAAVHDYEQLGARLADLRKLGVRVAIDDTGAGYASLTHLVKLVPDVIKLDRSLVSAIEGDTAAQALASGIVGFAERIGASVVAEGIERREQLRTLVELGVQHGQGYCFQRPAPLPLKPSRRQVRRPAARRAG